jgi:superfamily I DNA and/or RNA helicase
VRDWLHLSRRAGDFLGIPTIKTCNTSDSQRNAEMACMRFDYVVVDEAAQVFEMSFLSTVWSI